MKREDLNHPLVSGNKWWKLKYNLVEAVSHPSRTILTFGGAYSNHIYATAAAAHQLGLSSIGIIRGEETLPLNETLSFAASRGMKLQYVSRDTYRTKTSATFVAELEERFGACFIIPEGGTNELAIRGCEEFGRKLQHVSSNYVCLPIGTGGTVAGIAAGISGRYVVGVSVLKNADFLKTTVDDLMKSNFRKRNSPVEVITNYDFGGYAKTTPELLRFIREFEANHGIPLEPVYSGKMMYAVCDLIARGFFERGSTILAIHTGGLRNAN